MKTLCICMFFVLVLLCGSLRAQGEAVLEKILVVYSAGGSHNSVWIPYEAGIFRKNGLDVELLFVAGGSTTAQVVQSGQAPIGYFYRVGGRQLRPGGRRLGSRRGSHERHPIFCDGASRNPSGGRS